MFGNVVEQCDDIGDRRAAIVNDERVGHLQRSDQRQREQLQQNQPEGKIDQAQPERRRRVLLDAAAQQRAGQTERGPVEWDVNDRHRREHQHKAESGCPGTNPGHPDDADITDHEYQRPITHPEPAEGIAARAIFNSASDSPRESDSASASDSDSDSDSDSASETASHSESDRKGASASASESASTSDNND